MALIRWNRNDYARLSYWVRKFNSKIKELEREEKKLYLPSLLTYKEVKSQILTRQELNRTINSLKRFQRKGAEDIRITEGGEKLSNWEYKELKILQRASSRHLRSEIQSLKHDGVPYITSEERQLRATINNIMKLDNAQKADFHRIKSRILFIGRSDYEYKKAVIWRENYLKTIQNFSGYKGYDKLMEVVNSFSDPVKFFNFIKDRTEVLISDYLHFLSDKSMKQAQFNQLLRELGIDIEDTEEDLLEL